MRFKLIAVLFLLSAFLAPFVQPAKVEAWSSQKLGSCSSTGTDLSWNWRDAIQASSAWTTSPRYAGKSVANYDGPSIMFRTTGNFSGYSSTDTHVVFGTPDVPPAAVLNKIAKNSDGKYYYTMNEISIAEQNAGNTSSHFVLKANKTLIGGGTWNNGGNSPAHATGAFPAGEQGGAADLSCIEYVKNMTYLNTYDGAHYSSVVPNQGSEKCKALDVGCWIGKAFNGIGDGFNAVGQAIIKSITWLFVPESEEITAMFNNLSTALTEQLGFLGWVFEWFVDFFSAFNGADGSCTTASCELSLGTLFGAPADYDFAWTAREIPTVWNLLITFLRGLTVFGMLYALRHKLMEVLSK